MDRAKAFKIGLVLAMGVGLSACSSIRESRGYVVDNVLLQSVQPGIDNQRSVEGTLGRPASSANMANRRGIMCRR